MPSVTYLLGLPAVLGLSLVGKAVEEEEEDRSEAIVHAEEPDEAQHGFWTALGCVAVTAAGSHFFLSANKSEMGSFVKRLSYILKWETLTLVPLWMTMSNVASERYSGGVSDERDRILDKKTLYSMQQMALALGSHLVLSPYLNADNVHMVPTAIVLFTTGSSFYSYGQKQGRNGTYARSFGHYLAYLPSMLCLGYTAVRVSKDLYKSL